MMRLSGSTPQKLMESTAASFADPQCLTSALQNCKNAIMNLETWKYTDRHCERKHKQILDRGRDEENIVHKIYMT